MITHNDVAPIASSVAFGADLGTARNECAPRARVVVVTIHHGATSVGVARLQTA